MYILTGPIEYLQWSSAPLCLSLAMPYIVTQLVDTIEIHDICSLNVIQKIVFNSPLISIFSSYKRFSESNDINYSNNDNGKGNKDRFLSRQNSNNDVVSHDNNSNRNNSKGDENGKSKYQKNDVSTGIYGFERIVDLPHIYVCTVGRNNDQLYVLRMRSVLDQVRTCVHLLILASVCISKE